MRWDVKKIALAIALVFLAAGTAWLARTATTPPIPFDGKTRHDPDYIVENFRTTALNERGQRRYRLAAGRLVHFGDDGSSELDQPYLIQYGRDGVPVHTRADRGWLPQDAGYIVLRGNARTERGRDPKGAGGEIRSEQMTLRLDK